MKNPDEVFDEIQKHYRRQPFRPFTICLSDGSVYPIDSPEFMAIHPNGRVAAFDDTGLVDVLSLQQVTSIQLMNGSELSQNS